MTPSIASRTLQRVRRNRSVLACISGNLLLRLGNSATGVLLGLLLAEIDRGPANVPAAAVGLLASSFYATELLGAPLFGAQSDRRGRRPFMIAGPICGAAAIQLIGWPSALIAWPMVLITLVLGRLIEGLSTATSAPATLSFLSAATSGTATTRARVMAWYEMATVVGIGGGFVAGGVFWDRLGYGAFLAVTVIYGLSLASFLSLGESRFERSGVAELGLREGSLAGILGALRRPRIMRFAPAWLAVNTVVGVWFTHSAFQFTGEADPGQYLAGTFTGTSLGAAFSIFGLAFAVGIYLWSVVIGSRSRIGIMLVTAIGLYIICVGLFAINHFGQNGGIVLSALTGVLLIGVVIASGFTPAALAYLADLSEDVPGHRGSVMGLYSVLLGVGQLLGGALGGSFADLAGVDGLILLTAILASGAIGTVSLLRRTEGSRR